MSFLANHQVGAIVSANGDPVRLLWPLWLPATVAPPIDAGGVTLYRIAPATLDPYRSTTGAIAEREADWALFNGVLAAVANYLQQGRPPASLTPFALERLGLLPLSWNANTRIDHPLDTGREMYRGVWLGYINQNVIGICIEGSYDSLKPLIDRYRPCAYRIYFPYPRELAPDTPASDRGRIIFFFDPQGLRRAFATNSSPAPKS